MAEAPSADITSGTGAQPPALLHSGIIMDKVQKAYQSALAALQLGQHDEAARLFKKVLRTHPKEVGALNLLTIALMALERYAEAEPHIRAAVALNPNSDVSFYNYGIILMRLKRPKDAIAQFDRALALKPGVADTWNNRGVALNELEQYDSALADFDKALALEPRYAAGLVNKGKSLFELKRFDEALAAYDSALAIQQNLAEAWCGRGNVLLERDRDDEAIAAYRKSLHLKGDLDEAWSGLGRVLLKLHRFDDALEAHSQFTKVKPDVAEAWWRLGMTQLELRHLDQALAAFDKAVAIDAEYAEARMSRGHALAELRHYPEALASYDQALRLKPDMPFVRGSALGTRMQLCDWSDYENEAWSLLERIENNEKAIPPLSLLAVSNSPAIVQKAAKIWETASKIQPENTFAARPRAGGDKIRIGYFSADFHLHPVMHLIIGLLEQHDRSRFEILAFSFGPDVEDDMRVRARQAVDRFIDIRGMSNVAAVQLARELNLDIAVDLNGYTRGARTELFKHRVAPVQVNYLGFAGTLASSCMDYIIADRTVIPASGRAFYDEKVVYLPHSYMPNDDKRQIADRAPTRAESGLPETGTVFCCFNNSFKITPAVFACWMNILRRAEHSVLWLTKNNETMATNLHKEASRAGIDPRRLVFASRVPTTAEHLARHRNADLFLDTLPYNAHTTASDALWAGLPVLTRIGETFAGRVAASLLTAAGLPEMITHSAEDYEALAVALATDAERLADLKRKLAANRLQTPVFDTTLYARHVEQAYQAMHERQLAGLAPDDIRIAP